MPESDPITEQKRAIMQEIVLSWTKSLPMRQLEAHLGHIGLPHLLENSIIQDKLPETATGS